MAKNETKRLSSAVIASHKAAFNKLQGITGYAPSNPACAILALREAFDQLQAEHLAEDQSFAVFTTARDKASAAEWRIHNLMLLAKDQVRAQFGKDSTQLQEIGLKKTSDYRRPARKSKDNATRPPA